MTQELTYKRHATLVDRMANALGIDIEEKMMAGMLQIDSLGEAVLDCTGCSNPDGCSHWLDMQTAKAEATPGMCRNADLFAALKADKRV